MTPAAAAVDSCPWCGREIGNVKSHAQHCHFNPTNAQRLGARHIAYRQDLRTVSESLGLPVDVAPTEAAYREHGRYTTSKLVRDVVPTSRSRSWGEAMRRLGFKTTTWLRYDEDGRVDRYRLADEDDDAAVREDVYRVIGVLMDRQINAARTPGVAIPFPTVVQYDELGHYAPNTVIRHLAPKTDQRWAAVAHELHLHARGPGGKVTIERLLDDYRAVAGHLNIKRGAPGPTLREFNRRVPYRARRVIEGRFGTGGIAALARAAGYAPPKEEEC